MEDRDIVALYWQRDESAITESAIKYGSYCHSISYHILQNKQDAEECVNDTWVGAWNAMPPKRPERLSTFLGKITRNLSLNRRKLQTTAKRGAGQTELALSELEECLSDNEDMDAFIDEMLIVKTINEFLYAQSPRRRSIFVRRYWYLQSVREIASSVGMSERGCASLLFRMRSELKAYLAKEGIQL